MRRKKSDPCRSETRLEDRVLWQCFHCGDKGVRWLTDRPSRAVRRQTKRRHQASRVTSADDATRISRALRLWQESQPITKTLGETYLASRGVSGNVPADLRFHLACPFGQDRHPAMVAAIRSIVTNEITGIQRTPLRPDGSGKAGQRQMLGRALGGVVKFDDDAAVTTGLFIGEGVETCLSLRKIGLHPVWTALSAQAVAAFPVLPGIECLTIAADHDHNGTGQRAAAECAERWTRSGREARIITPKQTGDFNDVL
ncbi:DUF7146 domain-containing protein [Parvularcula marina]